MDQDTVRLIETAAICIAAVAVFVFLKRYVYSLGARGRVHRLAVKPIHLSLRYCTLVAVAILVLWRWGFPIESLFGGLGTILGLVAIGFVAVWSMLSNLLCTFALILMKPFSAGDEIELPAANVKGRVVDLNLIYTVLETAPDETVMVPNNFFFQQAYKRRTGDFTVDLEHQFARSEPHRSDAASG